MLLQDKRRVFARHSLHLHLRITFNNILSRLESLFSARGRHFSPSNLCAWENHLRIASPREMAYFSSIFYKFCALDWPLREWQFACARKIFSAHYILFSLAFFVWKLLLRSGLQESSTQLLRNFKRAQYWSLKT